ncbi:MAG: aspartate aminotransferase family protein [Bacteroidales bacterium]
MNLFDVYPLFDINILSGKGCHTYDQDGKEYLDLYGGHAVISIGHAHPVYVDAIASQVAKIGFYSNSVINKLQEELAQSLSEVSGYPDYSLFLVNSGAEANENALKLASFHTGRTKVIAFDKAFHGRTSAAVRVTDNAKIVAPINQGFDVEFLPWNDADAFISAIERQDACAVIIEGIQGIGGIRIPDKNFLEIIREACTRTQTILILDEIQSGYGRSGKFFAHQYAGIKADLITMAKGMGNGFPVGGVLISPAFKATHGLLGTTFGGNHLACSAALAVLQVIKDEKLIENAAHVGEYLMNKLKSIPQIKEVRGYGLMIGLEFEQPVKTVRSKLLFEHKIFTGATGTHVIRLLPPLSLSTEQADYFLNELNKVLSAED